MPRKATNALYCFIPFGLYSQWCEGRGIDMEAYPYLKLDSDPATGNQETFAVSGTRNPPQGAGMACVAIITYKSLASKSSHDVLVYS